MKYRGVRQLLPWAPAAVVLLVFASGCGSPANSPPANTTDSGAAPRPADATTTAHVDRATDDATEPVAETASGGAPQSADAANAAADISGDEPKSRGNAASGASVSGRVVFDGKPPERRVINMDKDAKCIVLHDGKPVLDEDLLVSDDGGVKNAFVYVRRGAPKIDYLMPTEPARLDQQGCMYRPRVQGMRVGQRLLVGNSDPVTHNVRSFPLRSRPFNFGQPPDTEPRERIFEAPEREIEVQCDIHPWMHAYLFVMDHPFFAVTDETGAYTIEGLPPGDYTLAFWHEKLDRQQLAKQQQKITVAEDNVESIDFAFPQ